MIFHKNDVFKNMRGAPIFINRDDISNFDEDKLFKYNKNRIILDNSLINITDEEKNIDKIESKKHKTYSIEDDLHYYIVGLNLGRSNGIYNKASLITRKRYEQIKYWIDQWIKKNNKINIIKILSMENNFIDDLFLSNLSKLNYPTLTHLYLKNNSIRKEGAKYIANSNLPYLLDIDLSNNDLRENGVQQLFSSKNIKHIQKINLTKNKIGKMGLIAICEIKLIDLVYLNISFNNLKGEEMLNLSNAKFQSLEYINLSGNKISDNGIKNLLTGDLIFNDTIQVLILSYNKISNEGLEYFSSFNKFKKIQSIDLSGNTIGHECLKKFANSNLGMLKELILSENKIGDEGLINISTGKLYSLRNLLIDNCEISDIGLYELCKGNFPYLENLSMKNNKITDRGSNYLVDNKLSFLKFINLEKNKIGSDGKIQLLKMKNCNIVIENIN